MDHDQHSDDRAELDRVRRLVGRTRETLERWLTEPVDEIDTEEAEALLEALRDSVPSASDPSDASLTGDDDGDDVDQDELRAA